MSPLSLFGLGAGGLELRLVGRVRRWGAVLALGWGMVQGLGSAGAETGAACAGGCRHGVSAPGATSDWGPEHRDYRKYARERDVDFLHLRLEVTPDFQKRTLSGTAEYRVRAMERPVREIRLDAVDLRVGECTSSGPKVWQERTDTELVLRFSEALAPGQEVTLRIPYSAEPARGMYFRTREMGYPHTQLWTQGETVESRHWFPCFDDPSEKLTTEVICHVPEGMVALSNGRRVSVEADGLGGRAHRWVQEKPHVNYLVALMAGEFGKLEERHGALPLEFWAAPSDLPEASNTFRHTRHMMGFFEREIGVPFPWAKYAQVAIWDYHWGGMENTSLTTLNARTLFHSETENLFTSDGLVAHELAHQWFGDLVTCKDWSHVWLNEGFATYYDWLWQGEFGGRNELLGALYGAAKGILEKENETRGIVSRKYRDPGDNFGYLAYPKGAWVLHMLRSQLGADLYRRCIQRYVEKHALGSVTTEQLREVIEEVSGLHFERFFDQWVYGVGTPRVSVEQSWDAGTKLLKLSVKQTQKISEEAPLFEFPLRVRVEGGTGGSGTAEHTLQVRAKQEDFYLPLAEAPRLIRLDPELSVLARFDFQPPKEMLLRQLENGADLVGQLLALEGLGKKLDRETVAKVAGMLSGGWDYRVRARAAEVLREARSPEALEALVKVGLRDGDARVRSAAVGALGGFYEEGARRALLGVVAEEKNPGVVATALRALGAYADPEVARVLGEALERSVYRERVAEAAIGAIRAQGSAAMGGRLREVLQARGGQWPASVLGAGLEALGAVERASVEKEPVLGMLRGYLNHPKESVRVAAIQALGNLEDARAIPVLEGFAGAGAHRGEKVPAERALERIRGARKPDEELGKLRSQVLELEKQAQEAKKELETLRKRVEAKP
ncbi:MAG: Aminopeptidase [Verrucomicrobiota bacterium]